MPLLLEQAWRLSDSVSLRPEPFGAMAYDFATRRLSFLKSRPLVAVVELLAGCATVEEALEAFTARRAPRVGMVLGNSLQLAEWEIHPETPGADPGRVMGQTLHALCEPA